MAWLRRVSMVPVLTVALVGLLAFAGSAFAQESIDVDLEEKNGSGISGSATLEDLGNGMTRVTLSLDGAAAGPQPVHIHPGPCEPLEPKPIYPLTNIMNGESITEVQVSLADLQSAAYSINAHKSPEEAAVYVACGEIPMVAAGAGGAAAETPGAVEGGAGPGKLPASGSDTTNWLLVSLIGILGLGGLGVGAWLRRRSVEV